MNYKFFICILVASILSFASDDFLWGVANSAFQVEGNPVDSDWYRWTKEAGRIEDASNADSAVDFWNRYQEDIQLASELGSKAFRISIAWERIQPEKNKWNLVAVEHYRKIIQTIRQFGMSPIVTLHHFVLPYWISSEGGLLSSEFPVYFAKYADFLVALLSDPKDGVEYWMTFNEPNILVISGYLSGEWPPGLTWAVPDAFRAMDHLIKAHRMAFERIKKRNLSFVKIGIAHHWRDIQKLNDTPIDRLARNLVDRLSNYYFIDGLQKGSSTLDYIGVNYYGRTIVTGTLKPPFIKSVKGDGEMNDLGWEIYPSGLTNVLREVYGRYKLPIIISENGLADKNDDHRTKFIKDHVQAMKAAINEGIPVFGYLHWSITDNFEWAKGLVPRFGLVEVDYSTNQRKPRPSFYEYKKIISDSILSK